MQLFYMKVEFRLLTFLFLAMIIGMVIYYFRFYWCPYETLEACAIAHTTACDIPTNRIGSCSEELKIHECVCHQCSRCMSTEQRMSCLPGKFVCA
jgi:hypothetical protein